MAHLNHWKECLFQEKDSSLIWWHLPLDNHICHDPDWNELACFNKFTFKQFDKSSKLQIENQK